MECTSSMTPPATTWVAGRAQARSACICNAAHALAKPSAFPQSARNELGYVGGAAALSCGACLLHLVRTFLGTIPHVSIHFLYHRAC